MEAMKMREGCEEEEDWTLVCRVPRMKEDDDDVNDEETTTRTTMTCVWLRDQRRLRWTSFSRGRRAPNVRVGR